MIDAARTGFRLVGFLGICARSLVDFYFNVRPRGGSAAARADWCHRWSKAFVRFLNIELRTRGTAPGGGVLACNHLSYLDIVILSAVRPQVFLSKAEVRNWPIIGAMTRCAGTLFIRRDRKADVAELQKPFAEVIEAGLPITLFPEGTSSDGSKVLPFFPSLFEPAARADWQVTPGWLGYALEEGSVADEICYWRDMTFFPHLLNVLSKKRIHATIVYGDPLPRGLNRKEMAAALHREVSALAATHRQAPAFEPALSEAPLAAEAVS